jgi:hypothetical protein
MSKGKYKRKREHTRQLQKAPRQESDTGIHPAQYPEDKRDHGIASPVVALSVPPIQSDTQMTKQSSNDSSKGRRMRLESIKTILEIVAIPFAIGYAIITFLQWRDANRNFRIDQRPYVVVKGPGKLVDIKGDTPIFGSVPVINVGRTPAKKITTNIALAYFPGPKPGKPGDWVMRAEKDFLDVQFEKLITSDIETRKEFVELSAENDLAPNADFTSQNQYPLILNDTQVADITSHDGKAGALFLIGLINYADTDEKHYFRTEFCWYSIAPDVDRDWIRCKFRQIIR